MSGGRADGEACRRALLASSLFQALQPEELEAVLARAITRRYEAGSTILRRGDPGSGMVVVLSGQVRVGVVSADGRETVLAVLGVGEILGEMSLLDGQARSADATAMVASEVLLVGRAAFAELLSSAALCRRLLLVLCGRLRQVNTSVEELATLDLPARLGRLLLRLAPQDGEGGISPRPGPARLSRRVSQQELANLVSASREAVNRLLRRWEEEGTIALERGTITLLRPAVLRALAHRSDRR